MIFRTGALAAVALAERRAPKGGPQTWLGMQVEGFPALFTIASTGCRPVQRAQPISVEVVDREAKGPR